MGRRCVLRAVRVVERAEGEVMGQRRVAAGPGVWRRGVGVVWVVAAVVVLPACGPALSTRPAIPFEAGQSNELDLSVATGTWLPMESGYAHGWPEESGRVGVAGQASYYHQFDNPFGFGLTGFGGNGVSMGGGGLIFRFRLTEPSTPIDAAEEPGDGDAEPAERARELAEVAAERARAGRWGEALGLFEEAEVLAPERSMQHAVALCRCQLGNYVGALSALETSLRQRGDRLSPAQRANAEEWGARLQRAVEASAVSAAPPTTEVCPALPPSSGVGASTAEERPLRVPGFGAAVELQGGYLWAEASFPLAVRFTSWWWLYTGPGVGVSLYPFVYVRLPLGFSLRLTEWWLLLLEFSPRIDVLQNAVYLDGGVGFAFRF